MHQKRILVVENDPIAQLDICAALERAGYSVSAITSSGEEALVLADSLAPDLVLMDIRLDGEMDGVEAANEIIRRFDLPVIYLSIYADDETLHWAKVSGPLGYLIKPVNHNELRSAIEVGLYRHQMERELRKAKRAAETADHAKTAFLATVSHELRTPMNGVLGMTELLLLSDLGAPYRENVQIIKESAMSLLSVLNQIIDYSKLETSSLKLREIDFRPVDLVTGLISQYERTAGAKGIRLEHTVSPEVPEWVLGDSGKMRQMLGNLLNNAVKFTKQGSVSVDVSLAEENSVYADDNVFIVIQVKDTGVGIPSEKLEVMFDAFTQGADYLAHETGALGLGLAIVQRLAKLVGGTVECISKEGKGSCFSLTTPFKQSRFVQKTPMAAIMANEKPLEGGRVLVVEDDLVSQRYIVRLLERMGCAVDLAEEGQEAIDILKEREFDIVFMDVQLPGMNGLEATRLIRDPATGCLDPSLPVVALTAHAMWGDEQRCLEAGMDDYVPKPVDLDTIAAIIQTVLEKDT